MSDADDDTRHHAHAGTPQTDVPHTAPEPAQDHALGNALYFEGRLPLSWQRSQRAHTAATEASVLQANTEVLRILSSLDEHAVSGHTEEAERGQELMRLEAKLDLVLDLLGHLLRRDTVLPVPSPVRLSASALEWTGSDLPDTGTSIVLEVYLDERYPRPLRLFAQVAAVTQDRCLARFSLSDDVMRDALEKFIFRHHRRSIAHRRR